MDFRWNDWNIDHIAEHGITADEAEGVVLAARRSYPRRIEEDKWIVWGRGTGGRPLQVIYLLDDGTTYIIHARPLNDREKRLFRRRRL